ncbi:MAG: transposase [Methanothrix sp.]|nr:transposase [Methanothrix sp.]
MVQTYRYRLYPTKTQCRTLQRQLDICRWVYNDALAYRKNAWENEHRQVKHFETQDRLPQLKVAHRELKEVYSHVLQNVTLRVELAFKSFFRRVKAGDEPGYPRFKGKNWYDSFTYPESGFKLTGDILHLSKIGNIKVKLHRPINGKITRLTIRRSATGKWFVSFLTDHNNKVLLPNSEMSVGIDVGISSFAMLSDGTRIDNPRFIKSSEKALAKVQRKLSKQPKGTLSRLKARKTVAHAHEKIANRRDDFVQKVSRDLVNSYGVICFENLNIKGMVHNHCLAKSIMDCAWGKLVQYTSCKAASAGRSVVLVEPNGTSQMCSACGRKVAKDLSVRVHDCPFCGLTIDRDHNAAINILRLGLQSMADAQMPANSLAGVVTRKS